MLQFDAQIHQRFGSPAESLHLISVAISDFRKLGDMLNNLLRLEQLTFRDLQDFGNLLIGSFGSLLNLLNHIPGVFNPIEDVQNLDMWLDVNGKRMQTGSTSKMIFSCTYLVSYLSEFMTLMPGDIITTGTPPGVALGYDDPPWLQPGDVMTLGIDGLGEQRLKVVAWDDTRGD